MDSFQFSPEVAIGPVQEDWLAQLPEEKGRLFEDMLDDLEVSYIVLSVALHDAYAYCDQGNLLPARQQAAMFTELFDRLSGRLRGVLATLSEHGRQHGTHPRVAPLRPELFRSDVSQTILRSNSFLGLVALRRPSRYFRKLAVLDELVVKLNEQSRKVMADVSQGVALGLPQGWKRLEILHHDLNTCFCETSIVLKSFLCVLPGKDLSAFRKLLLQRVPPSMAVRPGRPTRFATRFISACGP